MKALLKKLRTLCSGLFFVRTVGALLAAEPRLGRRVGDESPSEEPGTVEPPSGRRVGGESSSGKPRTAEPPSGGPSN